MAGFYDISSCPANAFICLLSQTDGLGRREARLVQVSYGAATAMRDMPSWLAASTSAPAIDTIGLPTFFVSRPTKLLSNYLLEKNLNA